MCAPPAECPTAVVLHRGVFTCGCRNRWNVGPRSDDDDPHVVYLPAAAVAVASINPLDNRTTAVYDVECRANCRRCVRPYRQPTILARSTPADLRNRAPPNLKVFHSWLMAINVPDSSSAIKPVAAPITAVEVDEQPAALISPPENADFLEKESLTEYCTRLPDARLCQHPNARSLLNGKSRPSGSRSYGRESCDQLVDAERRRRCLEKLQIEEAE